MKDKIFEVWYIYLQIDKSKNYTTWKMWAFILTESFYPTIQTKNIVKFNLAFTLHFIKN